MFQSLTEKLGGVFDKLRGKGSLSEEDVNLALREIRVALLEADVALPVVKDFVERIREQAIGQDIIKSVSPAQQVVKIVHDEMVNLLGADNAELKVDGTPPVVYLMVGLQGSGKTTSTAKISKFLTDKKRKKVLMASLDTYRPAAQDQLAQLGTQTDIATLPVIAGENPVQITERAIKAAKLEGYDILMLDTAGRLAINDELMNEVVAIRDLSRPTETLLVVDAMTGQDAVNTAKAFDEKIGITGLMLTRVDGDARGGAAMSMRAVTGKPIKLLGIGEKWDALEPFHADRIAGRILGMGDVVSLVERAVETINQDEAEEMARKFQDGKFDLNDMLSQFRQMKKMGGIGSLMKMLPGLGRYADQIDNANLDDSVMKHQEAIIQSMTKKERAQPNLLNASRRKRIATGSGLSVQDVNRLIKQYEQMEGMMRRMKKMGVSGMLGAMKGFMGQDDQEKLTALQQEAGTAPGFSLSGPMAGMGQRSMLGLPGMGGFGHGGTKKNRKKKR
ncbi:MAG: signal recognition particle protein [Alphaproteobacteria bacterium]|jgi:signal recognition particle subunit SRP54|nr:signal recognition particle protein [Alphaproteobacteria bacterium]MCB9984478.1 signal recognition particle protein [Micavibrio sp.]MCB1552047.1 signal recognition particle protein [Alphaproteobacteria bacterium]HPQ50956.1 signal recognition particle protein [Alphaproteobacteria bacterium]HRK97756.1 signal recognition particle protein [Alphaproteobacteria bacterium]